MLEAERRQARRWNAWSDVGGPVHCWTAAAVVVVLLGLAEASVVVAKPGSGAGRRDGPPAQSDPIPESSRQPDRRLAAIVAADVVGYSRLMETDEAGTLARLKTVRLELIDPAIARCKGRIIKTTGDGMLVEFQSVTEALRCAVDFQERMARRNRDMPASRSLVYRMGVNLGDVIVEGDDIFGDGVNVAARLESTAEPGGICISSAVRDQVGDRLELVYEDLGHQQVKNINRP